MRINVTSILNRLKKGASLRQIGSHYGISNQKVWRIGDANGVYSVRSSLSKKTAKRA